MQAESVHEQIFNGKDSLARHALVTSILTTLTAQSRSDTRLGIGNEEKD